MLGYTPLGHMLGENDKIKTNFALNLNDIIQGFGSQISSQIGSQIDEEYMKALNDAKRRIITYIIIFAIIAFLISFISNDKCKIIPRLVKSIIAGLLGLIYIILFLIKYSLSNC